MRVSTIEDSGLKQIGKKRFVELEVWKKRNPGKTPPASAKDNVECLQLDGSKQMKDGVWELIGEAGEYHFEQYEDKKIRSERELSNGTMALSATMGEDIHDAARSFLKTARPMTMEELEALQIDSDAGEGGEEDVGSDETSGNGTDSDEAEAELREETPLFRSMGNPAASSTSLAKGAKTITKGGSKQVQQQVQQKVTKGGAAQQQVQQKVKRQVQQDDADDDKDEEDDEEDDDQDEEDDDNNEDELAGTSDGRVSALDGRAERLRKGLQDSIRPLKERSDKLMDMQHLDTEDFLGTGAKFKGEIRTHAAEAKTVQREIKVVHKRLNVSTKPAIFKAEQDVIDEITKVTNAVSSACKIIIDAVCELGAVEEALQSAKDANVRLSPTFTLFKIWKQCEHKCSLEKFEEVIHLLDKNSAEISTFRDGISGL